MQSSACVTWKSYSLNQLKQQSAFKKTKTKWHFTALCHIESVLKTEYYSRVFISMWTNFKVYSVFKNATYLNIKRKIFFPRSILSCREMGPQNTITASEHFLGALTAVWIQQLVGQFGKDNRNQSTQTQAVLGKTKYTIAKAKHD